MASPSPSILKTIRIRPKSAEKAVAISLLDCTTADFAPACAVWLYNQPQLLTGTTTIQAGFDLGAHFAATLATTLEAYPQCCGRLKYISSTDGSVDDELARRLPPHARRFGRIYAHYGTDVDPGAEFIHARSTLSLHELYPANRARSQPMWNSHSVPINDLVPKTAIAKTHWSNKRDESPSEAKPLIAIQFTELSCGGFSLSVKCTHPLADIATLMCLLQDWASISRAVLLGADPPVLAPQFNPSTLDALAAGDVDADHPSDDILRKAMNLPLHRYDWWLSSKSCPWPVSVPDFFQSGEQEASPAAGKVMPWHELDSTSPVSNHVLHLTRKQVEHLWIEANRGGHEKLSQHDAILAHVWSCISRARNLANDSGPTHCDLVYGVRSGLNLPASFLGSPTMMMNIELPGDTVSSSESLHQTALKIRQTLQQVSKPDSISAHLHSLAYESSPQRIWQAFLGRRHILVTTWARAGVYSADFGLGGGCVYAEGVIPDIDGNVLIKEAPPQTETETETTTYWTDNGVDVSIHIRTEDMERLISDPLLFPSAESVS